jgi:hypothetical protein
MAKAPIETAVGRVIHGTMDNVVYRVVEGDTFLARRPRPSGKPPTIQQIGIRDRFRESAKYAKAVLDDPVRKQPYLDFAAQHGITNRRLRGVIARDWWMPPVVGAIDINRYQRQVGDEIRVTVNDDVIVKSVLFKITRSDTNALLEQGPATYVGPHWRYVATTAAPAGVGLIVEIMAEDLAENQSIERMGINA